MGKTRRSGHKNTISARRVGDVGEGYRRCYCRRRRPVGFRIAEGIAKTILRQSFMPAMALATSSGGKAMSISSSSTRHTRALAKRGIDSDGWRVLSARAQLSAQALSPTTPQSNFL